MDASAVAPPCLLFVDPDPEPVEAVEGVITGGEQLAVRRVDSVDTAIEIIETDGVDCLVTERTLPDGDGIDLLERVRERSSRLPVVFYTDDGDEELAARALGLGADGYVRKTADGPDGLVDDVTGLLARHRSDRETPDDVDEFAVLHAATMILSREEPLGDRLHSLAYALADAFGPPDRTAVRVSVDDMAVETPGMAAATVLHSATVTTTDGAVVSIDIGHVGPDSAAVSDPDRALFDAVAGVVQAQVDDTSAVDVADERNEFLRSFLNSTDVVLSVKSEDGRYDLVNGAFERCFGVTESEAVGRTDEELFPRDLADRLAANDRRVLEAGDAVEFDEIVEVRGRTRPFLTIKAPLLDEQGTPRGIITIATDLSEHAESLVDREQILDRMTDAVIAVDDEWRYTFVNGRAQELLDREESALIGEKLWDAFPETVGSVFEDRLRHAMAEQETVEFEAEYEPLETRFAVTAYPSESGLSMFARDVTEQRRTEAELEDSVRTIHRLYKTASDPDLAFEAKLDRMLSLGNDRLGLPYGFLTRITGDEQHIVASVGDHRLLQPGERCALEESYCRKTIDTDGILAVYDAIEDGWETDLAYETFDLGSYIGGKVVVDGELYGTLCFAATDARKRSFSDSERTFVELASRWVSYELERRQYRTRLERQNDRLEQFASTVSHDLRNPLTVASGHTENLLDRHPDDPDAREVETSLDRAFTIIEDVLAFARSGDEVVDRERVGLESVLRQAWDRCAMAAARLEVDGDLGELDCDPDRLQQLLENLLRNAIDHGPADVTVHAGRLEDGFYVEDDGPGFGDADREQLFEFGYTDSEDGTGFGLAIVSEIAEAHGWTVDAVDGDRGARFEFTDVEDIQTISAVDTDG